jgi:N-acetylmuramic acid 6-phosphate etherase
MTEEPDRYKSFTTEQPNPASEDLDLLSPREFLALMQTEDKLVLDALGKVEKELVLLIEELAHRFRSGGRLFYVGAGTSGRLGALDAAECPPTFGASPEMVQTILAGGYECLVRSVEGAEDDRSGGVAAIAERRIASADFVLGIAASSSTPFVRGALSEASRVGAFTVLLTCNESIQTESHCDRTIVLATGPEVLTGSTRLKAGTATKMFLNRLTTGAMIRIGKVYKNRMVDLYLTCDKLRERAIRTTRELTGLSRDEAILLLSKVGGSVKVALLVHSKGVSPENAQRLLETCNGHLRNAMEAP